MSRKRIGVLAVQGAFAEHAIRLRELGCEVLELRQRSDVLRPIDGLVLPGGESTAQAKLLRDLGMLDPLKRLIEEGLPVLGTCAGLILLAETVESTGDGRSVQGSCGMGTFSSSFNDGSAGSAGSICNANGTSSGSGGADRTGSISNGPTQIEGFRTLPVVVLRNGYGRQLGSFTAMSDLASAEKKGAPLVFIRAPRIVHVGSGVETVAALNGEPVAVRFENQVGCCFHPELGSDSSFYEHLL